MTRLRDVCLEIVPAPKIKLDPELPELIAFLYLERTHIITVLPEETNHFLVYTKWSLGKSQTKTQKSTEL